MDCFYARCIIIWGKENTWRFHKLIIVLFVATQQLPARVHPQPFLRV